MNRKSRSLSGLFMILVMLIGPVFAQPPDLKEEDREKAPKPIVEEPLESEKSVSEPERAESKPKMIIKSGDDELISINFLDVEIREALSALAIERELNVATAQDVSGKVSVHLYEVTLTEALDAITLAGGFSYQKQGNLYYIYKPKEEWDPDTERLQMRIFELRYADLENVQGVLSAIPGMRTIKIHDSSKTIIVEDTPENIEKIENIIEYWDRTPKQVMIEVKILEVDLTDEMSMGINWNDLLGDIGMGVGGFSTATMPTTVPVSPVSATGKGLFANLITGAGTQAQFTAALDALQTKTRVNTLSTPKILAIHGKSARVQVGGQQGYRVTTTNQGVASETIEFIDTGTILEITPYIDDKNNVLLNVRPSINAARIEAGIPVVQSTEVSTWLMAKSGETVFIGGLIQDSKTKTRDMIPCLGSVIGLGVLFGMTSQAIEKSELIVLITPNVLDSGERPMEKEAIEKTEKIEDGLKKEHLPPHQQLLDFIKPVK